MTAGIDIHAGHRTNNCNGWYGCGHGLDGHGHDCGRSHCIQVHHDTGMPVDQCIRTLLYRYTCTQKYLVPGTLKDREFIVVYRFYVLPSYHLTLWTEQPACGKWGCLPRASSPTSSSLTLDDTAAAAAAAALELVLLAFFFLPAPLVLVLVDASAAAAAAAEA